MKKHSSLSKYRGFTMLEILLVVAAIAILAGIVIVAINPAKQLGDTRNARRASDVNAILNGVYQYMIDNEEIPSNIYGGSGCPGLDSFEICKSGNNSCNGLTDLSVLTDNGTYLVALPEDPTSQTSANGTGYHIFSTTEGRITVCAPHAERGETIEVTR